MNRKRDTRCQATCPIEGLLDVRCACGAGHGGEHWAIDERVESPYHTVSWTDQCADEIGRLWQRIEWTELQKEADDSNG